MCRALSDGGRRCPCNSGSRRRAYRRALYASRSSLNAPALAHHEHIVVEERSAEETRHAAFTALDTLRELPSNQWKDSEELKKYVSAVTAHGDVLRERVMADVERAWESSGVSDSQLQNAIREQTAFLEGRDAHFAKIDAARQEAARIKEDNLDWDTDPELRNRVRELAEQCSHMHNEWYAKEKEFSGKLYSASKMRSDIMVDAVRSALSAERSLGGDPFLSELTKLTKDDKALFSQMTSMFPSEMIEKANNRGTPLRPKRSKRRAHYGGRVSQTLRKKQVRAGVLQAKDVVREMRWWDASMEYKALEGGVPDSNTVLKYNTVEDTEDNRAAIARTIAQWKEDHPRAATTKIPVMAPIGYTYPNADGVVITEHRLAVYIPEANTRMVSRQSNPVGELTFNGLFSMTHEFGHHIEYGNPEVGLACKEFLRKRTDGLPREVYVPKTRTKEAEIVTPDGFADEYIGKHYDTSPMHTEVFSMGVEALLAGNHGCLIGTDIETSKLAEDGSLIRKQGTDLEHVSLVMGLLAVANRNTRTVDNDNHFQ